MAVNLSPIWGAGAQLLDNSGNVLSGGKIYTYAAGTTTQVATYTSNSGITANSNPIVLNSAGRVPYEIWLTDNQNYKFVLKDSNDVLIGTWDNLSGINSNFIAYTNQQEIQTATAGQTVFNLATMNYLPGTNSLSVFVDGVNQYGPGAQYAFEETDSNTVTFASGLHVGAEVKFTSTQTQGAGAVDASQVSYTPPFTNSVPTNVEDKLAQYVSAKDFGVVGDGVVDDTAALQAFFDEVTSNGSIGIITAATCKITAPLTISITDKSFSIQGAGAQSTIITADTTFAGGTSALTIVGDQTPVSWEISDFSIQGTINDTGTAITGITIGDAATANIGILGYTFSRISQIYVTGFETLWSIAHARMIHFEDCSGWGNDITNQTCLSIEQNGAFTGDLYFERCQFVNKNDTGNKCVSISSPVGPYNFANGFCSIAGIKFSVCDFYAGEKAFYVKAADESAISDIWLMPGCQIDQETVNAIWFEAENANTIVENINIQSCYINKSSADTITFTSTGTGGALRSLLVENCDIIKAQQKAITFYAISANLINDVYVVNNSIVDAATASGGAILFNDVTNVQVSGNGARQGFDADKPNYLIEFTAGTTGISCVNNFGSDNVVTALILDSSNNVPKVVANNIGYNPRPNASITLGASPYTYTNTSGSPQIAFFGNSGSYTFTQLQINGSFLTPDISQQYMIPAGADMIVTYTGGLTAQIAGL